MKKFKLEDIQKVYFCAGARNHSLKSSFKNAQLFYELDERSAAYKALGSCMANEVAAVCVTSGTALAQCLAAMIEARYSEVPLIVISGDRPKRLHGTGSAQTIDHMAASSGIAAQQVEILDTELESFELDSVNFPLHLNVLVDKDHNTSNSNELASIDELQEFVSSHSSTLFLVSHTRESLRGMVQELVKKTDYVFAETLSWGKDLSVIANEFELMSLYKQGKFDSIVRIGHTPLSKLWRVVDTDDIDVFSIDPRGLSGLSHGKVCSDLDVNKINALDVPRCSLEPRPKLEIIQKYPKSQMSWLQSWQQKISSNAHVYLGNSSVIRDFEAVQTKNFRTYGNRGANGIDGQLSSAIGIANSIDEKLYCILGDLTFLYDIGASFELPDNLEVIVLDNNGGRIFERVGITDEIVLENKNIGDLALHEQISVVHICAEQTLACFRELMS
ncbi:MAG: hypothetical protein KC478_16270 [Bacteriovoracaceae bacterium]|nr:hypothetical protein [Bacteriovoracaceae bacterium]